MSDARVRELVRANDIDAALELVVQHYGPEVGGFIFARAGHDDVANDIFSTWMLDVWRGLPSFRGDAKLRTWLYVLARRAASRTLRTRANQPFAGLPAALNARLSAIAEELRSSTAAHLKSANKDAVRELRASLSESERELLILRVDREMEWDEIARVLFDDDADVKRSAATLRKRFERTKDKLKKLAQEQGLL